MLVSWPLRGARQGSCSYWWAGIYPFFTLRSCRTQHLPNRGRSRPPALAVPLVSLPPFFGGRDLEAEHHAGLGVLGDVAVRHPQPGVGDVQQYVHRLPVYELPEHVGGVRGAVDLGHKVLPLQAVAVIAVCMPALVVPVMILMLVLAVVVLVTAVRMTLMRRGGRLDLSPVEERHLGDEREHPVRLPVEVLSDRPALGGEFGVRAQLLERRGGAARGGPGIGSRHRRASCGRRGRRS